MTDTQTVPAGPAPKPADLTARVAVYPSAMVRPVPSFLFSVPRGWVLDEAPDALVVARTPEQVDDFWVNAILSHDRVPRSVDFKQAAQVTWARIEKSTPSASVTMERLARFGTNVVYLRGIELDAPQTGRSLAQLHALFFAPAHDEGKTVDFFQFIATSPQDRMEQFGPAFIELVGSLRFTPAA
ncbi:MAG: hypothetical protein U5K30_02780 [Acidimicrobiales bacterium]|nr:hypothetical protein [Acidimicrobiales bacterium]